MIELLRRNWGPKLLSLALAYLCWAYVVGRSPGVRFINAPVELAPPEGLAVVDFSPREVRVRLQGDAPVLNRLSEQNVYVIVPLDSSVRAGHTEKVPVQERDVHGSPSGVTKEVLTPALSVTLARRVIRNVPVRVRVAGSPPTGFRVVNTSAEPGTIELSGPEDSMRGLEQVWTAAVELRKHDRSFTGRADLIKPDPMVALHPDTVQFVVQVAEIPAPREFELPVAPTEDGLEADPPRVRVRLEAPPSLLQRVADQVTAVADAAGLADRGGMATVRLDYGDLSADEVAKIHVLITDPPRVRLKRSP